MPDSIDAQPEKKVDGWAVVYKKFFLPVQAQEQSTGKSVILAYHDFEGCQRGAKEEFFLCGGVEFGQSVSSAAVAKLGCITSWKLLIIIDKTGNFP